MRDLPILMGVLGWLLVAVLVGCDVAQGNLGTLWGVREFNYPLEDGRRVTCVLYTDGGDSSGMSCDWGTAAMEDS